MYSVKVNDKGEVVSADHMNLIAHVQLGRTTADGWRFIDRRDFHNEEEFSKFVKEPLRHYYDKQGVLRRNRL